MSMFRFFVLNALYLLCILSSAEILILLILSCILKLLDFTVDKIVIIRDRLR